MDLCEFGTAVVNGDPGQNVFGTRLRVLDKHVKVPVVVKDTRIQQLVFELFSRSTSIGFYQVAIGELLLRILVEVFHVGVRGRAVEVEIILFHVLAMIGLTVCQAKHALLENRVAPVPKRQGEAELLLIV